MGYYSSDSSTPSTIFSEGLAYLKDNDEVKVNYEVSVIRGIDDYQVFDYVKIIDNEYNPAIRVKARVLEKRSVVWIRLRIKQYLEISSHYQVEYQHSLKSCKTIKQDRR